MEAKKWLICNQSMQQKQFLLARANEWRPNSDVIAQDKYNCALLQIKKNLPTSLRIKLIRKTNIVGTLSKDWNQKLFKCNNVTRDTKTSLILFNYLYRMGIANTRNLDCESKVSRQDRARMATSRHVLFTACEKIKQNKEQFLPERRCSTQGYFF